MLVLSVLANVAMFSALCYAAGCYNWLGDGRE